MKNVLGKKVTIKDKAKTYPRYLIDGIGWALAVACPALMFILLRAGHTVFFVYFVAAMTGTFIYGLLRKRIPH